MLVISIICLIIGVLLFMLCASSSDTLVGVITFIIGVVFIGLSYISFYMYAYKDGQIDYALGHINYELKVNSDSTKTWEYVSRGTVSK